MPGEIHIRCLSCGTLNRAPADKAGMTGKCGRCETPFRVPSSLDGPLDVSDSDFRDQVEQSSVPVLIEFWSPSCGHCVRMEPVIDEIARELTGRVKVAKVDVSRNARVPSLYEVRGTPAFVLIKDGKEPARFLGAMPREELVNRLLHSLQEMH